VNYDIWKSTNPWLRETSDECEVCGHSGGEDLERNQDEILDQNDGRLLCEACIESVNEKYEEAQNETGK
jgi:hypothetical protein